MNYQLPQPAIITAFSENHSRFQTQDAINRQVIWHLLLHPGKLALPDSYIFTEPFRLHCKQDVSPLLLAMELGRTAILTRDARIDSFAQSREAIAKLGLGTAERKEMVRLARDLNDRSGDNEWIPWPNDDQGQLGITYRRIITRNLFADHDEISRKVRHSEAGQYFIQEMSGVREIVLGALERANKDGRDDLRFTDIAHTIGLMCFGIPGVLPAPKIEQLAARQKPRIITKEAILDLLAIAGTAYDVNFSSRFGLPVQKMKYPEWVNEFCELTDTEDTRKESDPVHSFTVELPDSLFLDKLDTKDIENLLKARGNYESAYNSIFSNTRISSDDLRKSLEPAIREYCAYLGEYANKRTKKYWVLFGDPPKDELEKVLQRAGWIELAAELVDPAAGLSGALLRAGAKVGRRKLRILRMEKEADLEFYQDGSAQVDLY